MTTIRFFSDALTPLRRFAVALCLVTASTAAAQTFRLETLNDNFISPVYAAHSPADDRLFIVERHGTIRILDRGNLLAEPFLDINALVGSSGSEQGLLSVAFHPDYAQNRRFFVNYTNPAGVTVIARYEVSTNNPNRANPATASVLLTIPQTFANHNGGQLQFGPDGMLYIGMGDGGSANDPFCAAQSRTSLLGKLLRIDVDSGSEFAPYHSVPRDNPFVGTTTGPDAAYAIGLRNPWRFSFDRDTGDLFIGDVGQNLREEVDLIPHVSSGGQNFGWKMLEGTLCRNQSDGCTSPLPACNSGVYAAPILQYSTGGNCAVVGGYVYRGTAMPSIRGDYIYGDFCSGRIWHAELVGSSWVSNLLLTAPSAIYSFGEERDGELVVMLDDGTVRRIRSTELGEPGRFSLDDAIVTFDEGVGSVSLMVRRLGGTEGDVSVRARTRTGSALPPRDYISFDELLEWGNGDGVARQISISIIDDDTIEPTESFTVELVQPTGGAEVEFDKGSTRIDLLDNDFVSLPECEPSATAHCLNNDRFRVSATWRTANASGEAAAVPLTTDTGAFWFFSADNLELVVKVIDACLLFDRYWVFAGGLTNVEVTLTVTDTTTNETKTYTNPLGQPYQPLQDTRAFATCAF